MVTIKMHSRVDKDGILRLEIPMDASEGELEVTVHIQPAHQKAFDREEWLAFIERAPTATVGSYL